MSGDTLPQSDRPVLERGAGGDAVRELQAALARTGFPVDVDGQFGPATEDAVRRFQEANGIAVDGDVGPHTWSALDRAPTLRAFPNPVHTGAAADPGVLKVGNTYYMLVTGGPTFPLPGGKQGALPIKSSTDLLEWETEGAVFLQGENMPGWVTKDYWAPEAQEVGGRFICYYSGRMADGRFAIGAATATQPLGPWQDIGRPLAGNDKAGGIIDPSLFKDPAGPLFLMWKEDTNDKKTRGGAPHPDAKQTWLIGQEIEPDGTTLKGEPRQLFHNDRDWEGPLIEAPHMVKWEAHYYLFYSANRYFDHTYAVGVARSSSILGPYEKFPHPILRSNDRFLGPGHCSIEKGTGGELLMFYHAMLAPRPDPNKRMLLIDEIRWVDGWPRVYNGSPSWQPA